MKVVTQTEIHVTLSIREARNVLDILSEALDKKYVDEFPMSEQQTDTVATFSSLLNAHVEAIANGGRHE